MIPDKNIDFNKLLPIGALWAGAIFLAVFIITVFLYMVKAFHYVPQADDYRLTLYHIKPFLDKSWELKQLWSDVHPNPVHGIVLIGSTIFEQMRFQSMPYLIFPFIAFKWLLYYQGYKISAVSSTRHTQYIVLILFGFSIFAYNLSGQYAWNSVAIAQIYHAVGAIYLLSLAIALRAPTVSKSILVLVVALTFHIISRQYSIPWVVASIPVITLYGLYKKGSERRNIFFLIVALILSLVLERVFFSVLEIRLQYNPSIEQVTDSLLLSWWHRKLEIVKFFLAALASPVVKAYLLKKEYGFSPEQITYMVYFVSFSVFYAGIFGLINIRNRAFLIPLIMIVFAITTIAAGFVYRTNPGTDWLFGHHPRYDTFRNVVIIATVWILITSMIGKSSWRAIHMLILGCLLSLFFYTQRLYHSHAWEHIDSVIVEQHNVASQIRFVYHQILANPKVEQDKIRSAYNAVHNRKFKLRIGEPGIPGQRWVLGVIQFWGDNQLNIFNPASPFFSRE